MKEYLKYGFKNHPSISSEYVRFLIKNSGMGKIIKLEAENKVLKENLATVDELAKCNEKGGDVPAQGR